MIPSRLWPTATSARLRPRRDARRRNRAAREVFWLRLAAQAACTTPAFTQRFPLPVRPPRLWPALLSLPGHSPTHDARWPSLANACRSVPTSASPHFSPALTGRLERGCSACVGAEEPPQEW